MKKAPSKYDAFVEHPRYGRGPRLTGLEPGRSDPRVSVHWNATNPDEAREIISRVLGWSPPVTDDGRRRIPETAIAADTSRQQRATVQVTHYYDVERRCRDCRKPFIFFAVEQKHWYEVLRFPLEADAVRCPACRKRNQTLGKARATYQRLHNLRSRSETDTVRLAEALLMLVENGVFGIRQTEHARALVRTLPDGLRDGFLTRIRDMEEAARAANKRSLMQTQVTGSSRQSAAPRQRGDSRKR
jgi:hypothetical protein